MKKLIIAVCLFVMLVCFGCGPQAYWYNEEKTYSRARADCRECLYQAQGEIFETVGQELKEYGSSANVHSTYKQSVFEQCMKERGYKKTWDYQLEYYIRKGFVDQNDELYPIAGK